jgi:leucyl aminopeptidase
VRVEVRAAQDTPPEADVLAVPVGAAGLPAIATALDGGAAKISAEEDVASEVGRTAVLYPDGAAPTRRIVLVGLGATAELDADTLRTAAASVARETKRIGGSIAWLLDDSLGLSYADQARAVVDGLLLGTYDPGRWKADASSEPPFERLVLVGSDDDALSKVGERAATVASAANRARDLANTGANLLTPERLADRAIELAGEHANLLAEALGPEEVNELGMGAFSAVAP